MHFGNSKEQMIFLMNATEISTKKKQKKKSCFFIQMKMLNANYSLKLRVCKKTDKNNHRKKETKIKKITRKIGKYM